MSKNLYSKRQVNMMRVNALRSEKSIAKTLFIAHLCGVHVLKFGEKEAKNYPEDYYTFEKIIESMPNIEKLYGQINTYRALKIFKLLGTSVDNKKLSFLKSHKDPFGKMSAQDVFDIIQADLDNYKLLLDAFICHRYRKAIREVRSRVEKEMDINKEELKAYKIYMTIPASLKPLIRAYRKQEKR